MILDSCAYLVLGVVLFRWAVAAAVGVIWWDYFRRR